MSGTQALPADPGASFNSNGRQAFRKKRAFGKPPASLKEASLWFASRYLQ
ncbi:MAG TPA: hypothetical protein VFL79_21460 [Terriglobia bacterium]|nr:hypothetical protein [Terriglobia bacterium]